MLAVSILIRTCKYTSFKYDIDATVPGAYYAFEGCIFTLQNF